MVQIQIFNYIMSRTHINYVQYFDIIIFTINKNISYGDSALSPIRIFSQADNQEQIKIRIDDKINRIKNGQGFAGDNDIDDMIGYLILLKIAKKLAISVD